MSTRTKLMRPFALFLVNHVFAGTHAFGVKRSLLRGMGVRVGDDARVVGPLHIGSAAKLEIGEGCLVGRELNVDGNGAVYIERDVEIDPHVTFATGGHEIGTHGRRAGAGKRATQIVGAGTWVGTRVTVCSDTRIGAGCVVAAGAVVAESTPDNVLLEGVPAQVKRELDSLGESGR